MIQRYYVLVTTVTSSDTETREFTPYNVLETAQRKYHEAFLGIGGGAKRICAVLLDPTLNQVQREVWQQAEPEEETPEENLSEE